jgi:purine nucleosidase
MAESAGLLMGETYCLGDQPLVLLTALHSSFEADPSSSTYATRPTPRLNAEGWYEPRPDGRPMRVYTALDTRLMFEDMYTKIARFSG